MHAKPYWQYYRVCDSFQNGGRVGRRAMFGISTCWWHNRVNQGDEIAKGVLELGLDGIELEYRITETQFRRMSSQLQKDLNVITIHNYFPFPENYPNAKPSGDLFLLSAPDKDERLRAVQYSIRTIEHAHDLGAKVVILHLGRVDMPNRVSEIRTLLEKDNTHQDERLAFIKKQRNERRSIHQRHLDAVLFSLDALNREAEQRGLFLGIENRYHLHEIPDFDEMEAILEQFHGGNIRYWHDVGHAFAQEGMGIIPQKDLLTAFSEMLIGIHLHDAEGLDDHLAPGQGEIDFKLIKPFLKPSHIRILEVHSTAGERDLLEGIQYLRLSGIV
jgi:sugar phosphate isomerase/epimerase